ncbi:ABC transporter permease [Actinomadura rayongensis]|uniref:ABC transporter permease n=1 Tax=Actinomadura rayongensis TaxID=1429076 RepID=A0A6I4WBG9_9ACTN|nr:ABC transporter permease [Actinomadura rayongensis]MXQ67527.1 ABC transporter permease [Actinomadura rayongensis]
MTTATVMTTLSPADHRVTGPRVLRSETAKVWSLRSAKITVGLAMLFLVVFGWIFSGTYDPASTNQGPVDYQDAIGISLVGANFAQLVLGVFGVLIAAGEYGTGLIRSTFMAVPRRLPVLWSKAVVAGVCALVVGTAGAFGAFLIGYGLLPDGVQLPLTAPGVLRCLFGAGMYLGLVAVFGVALGMLLRNVAGGITLLVAGLLLLPELANLLPRSWNTTIAPYLPGRAGGAVMILYPDPQSLSPGAGLAVFAAWVAVTLAAATYRLKRTDA